MDGPHVVVVSRQRPSSAEVIYEVLTDGQLAWRTTVRRNDKRADERAVAEATRAAARELRWP